MTKEKKSNKIDLLFEDFIDNYKIKDEECNNIIHTIYDFSKISLKDIIELFGKIKIVALED